MKEAILRYDAKCSIAAVLKHASKQGLDEWDDVSGYVGMTLGVDADGDSDRGNSPH